MVKIKGWSKVNMRGLNSDTWWLDDGIEIESYGIKTKYPFIQVSRDATTPNFYKVRLVTTHKTIYLPVEKYQSSGVSMKKEQAIKVAINYMRANQNG
jgi:hypothetical protein